AGKRDAGGCAQAGDTERAGADRTVAGGVADRPCHPRLCRYRQPVRRHRDATAGRSRRDGKPRRAAASGAGWLPSSGSGRAGERAVCGAERRCRSGAFRCARWARPDGPRRRDRPAGRCKQPHVPGEDRPACGERRGGGNVRAGAVRDGRGEAPAGSICRCLGARGAALSLCGGCGEYGAAAHGDCRRAGRRASAAPLRRESGRADYRWRARARDGRRAGHGGGEVAAMHTEQGRTGLRVGMAGRMAAAFIQSKLTPLIILASLLLGAFAVLKTPREEEPQIIVPMMDVMVSMPGATAQEVERRVTTPMEKLLWEIPGVEYLYTTSSPGQSLAIVRFYVGQDQEAALVRLREKLQAHYDIIPPGASQPIIKPRSIDDVPILALTLHSPRYAAYALRQFAARVDDAIKQVDNVSETKIIGGRRREVRVTLD